LLTGGQLDDQMQQKIAFLENLVPFYEDARGTGNYDLFLDAAHTLYVKRFSNITSCDNWELDKEVSLHRFHSVI